LKKDLNIAENMLELLKTLFQINFTFINDRASLDGFVNKHRFHPFQRMFTSEVLIKTIENMQKDTMLILTDAFTIRLFLFYLFDTPVIMGPFTSSSLSSRDVNSILTKYSLAGVENEKLLYYISSFPSYPENQMTHLVSSLLNVLFPSEQSREILHINYFENPDYDSEDKEAAKRENQISLLEKRYNYEQAFIDNIKRGNARKAIQNLHNMQMDVSYLKRIGTTLDNEKVGAAIVRTTARLAAKDSGLPSVIIDKISSENTVSVIRAQSVDAIIGSQEDMIRDFCKAIRVQNEKRYSALVQSAIYSLEKEYANEITVESLAKELEVSPSFLIRTFKNETGTTPGNYLKNFRLKQAAGLLSATELQVNDIALLVGIPDANYMIKIFKDRYEMTPIKYRKLYRV